MHTEEQLWKLLHLTKNTELIAEEGEAQELWAPQVPQ